MVSEVMGGDVFGAYGTPMLPGSFDSERHNAIASGRVNGLLESDSVYKAWLSELPIEYFQSSDDVIASMGERDHRGRLKKPLGPTDAVGGDVGSLIFAHLEKASEG